MLVTTLVVSVESARRGDNDTEEWQRVLSIFSLVIFAYGDKIVVPQVKSSFELYIVLHMGERIRMNNK